MCVRAHGCEVREVSPSMLSFGVKSSLSGIAVKDSEWKLPRKETVGAQKNKQWGKFKCNLPVSHSSHLYVGIVLYNNKIIIIK